MTQETFEIIPGAEPFRLKGDGPKVLLIHGFTASPTEMRPIGDFLHKKGFNIYSVLLPGHGTSPEDLRTKKWQDWWNAVVVAFESIENCDFIIGFSMGALLAARLAVEYGSKLKGVILLSTFLKIKPRIISTFSFLFPIINLFKKFVDKSPDSEQFFTENNLISYMKYPVLAAYQSVKLANFSKRKVMPKVSIPVLIIQGEKDDRVDPSEYKTLQKIMPSKEQKLVLLPDSQHIITVGPDTELLFNSINDFLDEFKSK